MRQRIGTRAARRALGLSAAAVLLFSGLPADVATAGKPGGSTSSCPTTPSDLCTDYVTRGNRWAPGPIPYYINPENAPLGAVEDVQDAFATWQNEVKSPQVEAAYPGDRSGVSFVFMGLTSAGRGIGDGINVVVFPACGQCGAAAAQIAARRSRITEFEIVVNPATSWQTDLSCPTHDCGALDLQNVVTHEIGHVLDLYHPTDASASLLTMYPGAAPNETSKRDLGAGDVLGLRKLYPTT